MKTKDNSYTGAKRIVACVFILAVILLIFTGASSSNVQLGYSVGGDSGIYIDIVRPSGWHRKETTVHVKYEDTQNRKIKTIFAKIGEKGSWKNITDDEFIELSENSTVYVKIEDRTGLITEKSRYIECFDREKPTLKATLSGKLLRVEANDTLSGVDSIFVNGERYNDLSNDSVEVRLSKNDDEEIRIQAEDYAGNMSSVYTTKNPMFEDKTALSRVSASTTPEQAEGTATISPTSAGTAQTTKENLPGSSETVYKEGAGSADATDNTQSAENKKNSSGSSDDPKFGTFEDTNKQFMSIVTKDGKMFYMIVDYDKETENVYLLTEVSDDDLQSFTDSSDKTGKTGGVDGESTTIIDDTDTLIDSGATAEEVELIIEGENSSSGEKAGSSSKNASKTEQDSTDGGNADPKADGEAKKKNPLLGWIVIAILVAIVAFAGYMFLVFLPKKRAKEKFEDDDSKDEHTDDEYQDEYYAEEDDDEVSEEKSDALPTFAVETVDVAEPAPEEAPEEEENYDYSPEEEEN